MDRFNQRILSIMAIVVVILIIVIRVQNVKKDTQSRATRQELQAKYESEQVELTEGQPSKAEIDKILEENQGEIYKTVVKTIDELEDPDIDYQYLHDYSQGQVTIHSYEPVAYDNDYYRFSFDVKGRFKGKDDGIVPFDCVIAYQEPKDLFIGNGLIISNGGKINIGEENTATSWDDREEWTEAVRVFD